MKFFEKDGDDIVWEDFGRFTEADVHHQYAIALYTPPYKKLDIEHNVSKFLTVKL